MPDSHCAEANFDWILLAEPVAGPSRVIELGGHLLHCDQPVTITPSILVLLGFCVALRIFPSHFNRVRVWIYPKKSRYSRSGDQELRFDE